MIEVFSKFICLIECNMFLQSVDIIINWCVYFQILDCNPTQKESSRGGHVMCPVKCNAIHVVQFCVTLINRKAVDGAQRETATVFTEPAWARHHLRNSFTFARSGKLARKWPTVKTHDWRFNSRAAKRFRNADKCEVSLIWFFNTSEVIT